MLIVAFSAFLITPWRYLFDPNRTADSQSFSLFLFFIAALALNSLQQGISVFKYKTRKGPVKKFEVMALPFILVMLSIVMLVYGVQMQKWLIIIFAALGGRVTFKQYKYWSQPLPIQKIGGSSIWKTCLPAVSPPLQLLSSQHFHAFFRVFDLIQFGCG
jgi:hypothetical protein